MKIINKFLRLVLVLFMISIISFFLANISSVDSAETIGHHFYGNPSKKQIEDIRLEKGLDKPATIQYIKWLKHALTGDLGISYQTSNSVLSDIKNKLFATVKLVGASLFLIVLITIPLSLISAYKKILG